MAKATGINVAILIGNKMTIGVNIDTTDDVHKLQWDEMNASERYAYIIKRFYDVDATVKNKVDDCIGENVHLRVNGLVFNANGASKLSDVCNCSMQQLKELKLAIGNNTHAKGVKASKSFLKYGVDLFKTVFAADEENADLMISTVTGKAI